MTENRSVPEVDLQAEVDRLKAANRNLVMTLELYEYLVGLVLCIEEDGQTRMLADGQQIRAAVSRP